MRNELLRVGQSRDIRRRWARFQQLCAGAIDQYSLEKRYARKDGIQFWGRLNVSLWRNGDGGFPLVFAFVEGIRTANYLNWHSQV